MVLAQKISKHAFNYADELIREATTICYCVSVECAEHGAHPTIYEA